MAERPGEHTHTDEHPARLSTNEARQGGRSTTNLVALTVSLAVLAVVGLALLAWFWTGSPGTPG